MRLLFVLPFLPYPPSDGGRTKVFNILKFLATEHTCDLICLEDASNAQITSFRHEIPGLGHIELVSPPNKFNRRINLLGCILRLKPLSLAKFTSRPFMERIRYAKKHHKYDVIHYDIVNMATYIKGNQDVASLHSPNDATSLVYSRSAAIATDLWSKTKLTLSAWLISRFEQKVYPSFSLVHVVSDADKEYLESKVSGARIEVTSISSGYSIDKFKNLKTFSRSARSAPVVVICGNLANPAIAAGFEDFLDDVVPTLLNAFSDIRIRVLGRQIRPVLAERLRLSPYIECHTWVDDFDAFITSGDVIVIPDKAGAPGAKTRVVKAMALGKAVIGSQTAFEGVPIVSGREGIRYFSGIECVSALQILLTDEMRRNQMGAAAAQFAADHYALERIGPQYEKLYYMARDRHAALRSGGLLPSVSATTPSSPDSRKHAS